MRALIWVTVLLSALWGGYWFVGSRAAKSGAEMWLSSQGAQYQSLSVAGFPNRFDVTVTGVELNDAVHGIGWSAPFAQVFAMSWKPWHLIAALPNEQKITLPDQSLDLTSSRLMGSLLLVPGVDLALQETVVEGENLALTSSMGWRLAATKLVASTRLDPSQTNSHRLGLQISSLAPDPTLLPGLAGTGLPPEISEVHLDATASLTAPLDRHAAAAQPRLSALDLTEARLIWGLLKVHAKGALAADTAGFAAGEIGLRIEGWRALPGLLMAAGVVAPDFAPTLERGMEVMALQGGDAAVLNLALTAKYGWLSLGPFPLGPAPSWN